MTTVAVTRPKAYLKPRQQRVRDAMEALNLDALLITHAPDLAYLTNFTGDDSVGLVTKKDFHLVTDFRYTEQAAIEAGWLKVTVRDDKMSDTLSGLIRTLGVRRVGFESNDMTFGQVHALERALKSADGNSPGGDIELAPIEDVLVKIRKVKDDTEIGLIRESVGIAEEAFNALREQIEVGQSENYLAGVLIMELRSRGASDSSFPVIIAAGPNSSLPHYRPGEALVKKNQPLLIDWGALFKGYCSDLTRTLNVGRATAKQKKIYNVCLEAQLAAISFLRPGVTTRQADAIARDVIERAGFGPMFGHGLGHGIGRDIHELPALRKKGTEEELRPGMIVTVEPGIYLPGEGGVRIEDDVLITHSGCEVLSSLPKSFEECHIE